MSDTANLTIHSTEEMVREKESVARSSVWAAILLTTMKFIVGMMTGSLGVISEALHSGLDFVAAFITFVAVKLSAKPPDEKYNYGRGKIESFSALIETLLLLVTCVWIVHEAVDRLKGEGGTVEASLVSFVVMAISIAVDYSRSSALYRVAKKYNSQALMADALHFSSDILSSAVVIIGLIFVKAGYPHGDPIAALAVAILVIFASYKLGKETINCLMDRAPEGMSNRIEEAILEIPDIDRVSRLRVRVAGSETFVDANIEVSRALPLERAHKLAADAEERIRTLVPNSDVLIHLDPINLSSDSMVNRVIGTAYQFHNIKETHNITFFRFDDDKLCLELHVGVEPELTLLEAHDTVTEYEKALMKEFPVINSINTHIDVVTKNSLNCRNAGTKADDIVASIKKVVDDTDRGRTKFVSAELKKVEKELFASITCSTDSKMNIAEAHDICDRIEHEIQKSVRNLKYVLVHIEPDKS